MLGWLLGFIGGPESRLASIACPLPPESNQILGNPSYVALEDGIPITDPAFYASETRCPDSLIAYIFRASASSMEHIPLLAERIKIMREVGAILCKVNDDLAFLQILTTDVGA
jgi:Queuosine salvage protein